MALQWALVVHCLVTALVVVSFLCGQWPIFQGTFVERIHRFLTFGAYDYFLRLVAVIFGYRGRNAFLKVEHYCCERPNPVLQIAIKEKPMYFPHHDGTQSWSFQQEKSRAPELAIKLFYLGILGGTYCIIMKSSFRYIPGIYVSELHWYISLLAVGVGVLLFLLTSFSDPGTVNTENVSQYLIAYPYDNIIYVEKECSTCKIKKPARSKHCGICERCVARFDHHCGWMNNCIGEKNTRYFMAFLLWHFLLCLYGAIVLGFILAGQLKERRIIYILTVYYGIENSISSLFPHVVQWLLSAYNTQLLLIVFLAVVSLLLAGFFGYHAHLCLTNTTTNETFKWQDYISLKRKLNEFKLSAAAVNAGIRTMNEEGKASESKWRAFFRKSPLQQQEAVVKNNIYDKGAIGNVCEILLPLSQRRSFFRRKSA